MGHVAALENLYGAVLGRRVDAIAGLFDGPVALDTPLSGPVDGLRALREYIRGEGDWLRESTGESPEIVPRSSIEDRRRAVVELELGLAIDGKATRLPVVLVGQKAGAGFGQIRIYHSTWPIHGKHSRRPPIVWPGEPLDEPEAIERYFNGLARPDKTEVLSLFTEDGYVREPSGDRYRHEGPEGRERFYGAALDGGPIGLTHATATVAADGRAISIEYLCWAWGQTTFDPMAGCAVYELVDGGRKIAAARIYDDLAPPGE